MARRKGWRAVKTHRNYTVDEVARNQGVCRGTVRRWVKAGLPVLADRRPALILGGDLADFLKALTPEKHRCATDEFFCFRCKTPRRPAFQAVECRHIAGSRFHLTALCCTCSALMQKAASPATVATLERMRGLSISMDAESLGNGTSPG